MSDPSVHPPSALFLFGGAGMIGVGILAVLLWQRRKPSLWPAVGLGAAAWAVSVALKFAWAVPTNAWIHRQLRHLLGATAAEPLFWLYIGLLTGIFECGITWLFVARSRLKKAGWNESVAFGIGFGAMEAVVLGAVSVIGLLAIILFFDQIPAADRSAVVRSLGGSSAVIPLPVVERAATLAIHCLSCVLIVYGVRMAQWRWFWLSFAYKTAVDTWAGWTVLSFGAKESVMKLAQMEAQAAVFGVIGLVGLAALKPKFHQATLMETP
jgi:uncharacterized membrane protein YhfC